MSDYDESTKKKIPKSSCVALLDGEISIIVSDLYRIKGTLGSFFRQAKGNPEPMENPAAVFQMKLENVNMLAAEVSDATMTSRERIGLTDHPIEAKTKWFSCLALFDDIMASMLDKLYAISKDKGYKEFIKSESIIKTVIDSLIDLGHEFSKDQDSVSQQPLKKSAPSFEAAFEKCRILGLEYGYLRKYTTEEMKRLQELLTRDIFDSAGKS